MTIEAETIDESPAPPAPALLSRTDETITIQPRAWRCSSAADHVRVYGKPAGAGTDVSLTNVDLRGLGTRLAYDAKSGKAASVTVSELCPGESYVFAVAAFDANGTCLTGIGATSSPIEALHPLPLPLCYGRLAVDADALGVAAVAARAARRVYERLVDVRDCSGHLLRVDLVRRVSLAELHAFLKCAFILAGQSDNGGLPIAYAPGLVEKNDDARSSQRKRPIAADGADSNNDRLSGPAQVSRLTKVQVLRCAVLVASSLSTTDPELVLDAVSRCYRALLPLLKLRCAPTETARIVFSLMLTMHQALWLVPPRTWDKPVLRLAACLTYRIARTAEGLNERHVATRAPFFRDLGTTPSLTALMDASKTRNHAILDEILVAGIERGRFRTGLDPRLTRMTLLAACESIVQPQALLDDQLSLDQAFRAILDVMLNGVLEAEPAKRDAGGPRPVLGPVLVSSPPLTPSSVASCSATCDLPD